MFAKLFRMPEPQAHLSAHIENILAGDFGELWQDYADIVPLFPGRGHYRGARTFDRQYLTMCTLNQTFFYLARTAQLFHDTFGLPYEKFSRIFYHAFVDEFSSTQVLDEASAAALRCAVEPLRLAGGQGITQFLWDRVLALENFIWSKEHYDLPAEYFHDDAVISDHRLARQYLESEVSFLAQAQMIATTTRQEQLADELKLNLEAARRKIDKGFVPGFDSRSLMLPYLEQSMNAPMPRRPASWVPPV
jgi:hypothetical protein